MSCTRPPHHSPAQGLKLRSATMQPGILAFKLMRILLHFLNRLVWMFACNFVRNPAEISLFTCTGYMCYFHLLVDNVEWLADCFSGSQ